MFVPALALNSVMDRAQDSAVSRHWQIVSHYAAYAASQFNVSRAKTLPINWTLVQIDQVGPSPLACGPTDFGPTGSAGTSHWHRRAAGNETDEGTLLKLVAAKPVPETPG